MRERQAALAAVELQQTRGRAVQLLLVKYWHDTDARAPRGDGQPPKLHHDRCAHSSTAAPSLPNVPRCVSISHNTLTMMVIAIGSLYLASSA